MFFAQSRRAFGKSCIDRRSIIDAALDAGFQNASHFARVFRKTVVSRLPGFVQIGCKGKLETEFNHLPLIAGQRRHHHPARVAGLRVKRIRLTTTTHTRPMMGETNRE